jgi:serine phosphatase RsbU (regulator of sigma subunit)
MDTASEPAAQLRTATLTIINPSGTRTRVPVEPLPFKIGRQAESHLVLRDNRVSRSHSQIVADGGDYWVEDLGSRHGTYVNGKRIERHKLANDDRVEFGVQDSYTLVFTIEEAEINRILEQISAPTRTTTPGATNLAKLRALVEVARVMQSSLSTQDVLTAVVDAALAVTGSERGFLLLASQEDLEVKVARHRRGMSLAATDLRVPTSLINRALKHRRELLSMSFDPLEKEGVRPDVSVADLELSNVVCVPLVRVRVGGSEETHVLSTSSETVGLLYMDSRRGAADLSAGNRELLQTLALEASTILENARLLEEQRAKQKIEEELNIAREIQRSLLPRSLPQTGWFRAAGASISSHAVGGDYFDMRQISPGCWCTVVADVSGKGVSSALLAALLQGAFLLGAETVSETEQMMQRVSQFLSERTEGDKYATVFYCAIQQNGMAYWSNAGHCAPILLHPDGTTATLKPTGPPAGLLPTAKYGVESMQLASGDKLVIYTDGVSDAENKRGEFFENRRVLDTVRANAGASCNDLLTALMAAVEKFTQGAEQSDDVTAVVLEYL